MSIWRFSFEFANVNVVQKLNKQKNEQTKSWMLENGTVVEKKLRIAYTRI